MVSPSDKNFSLIIGRFEVCQVLLIGYSETSTDILAKTDKLRKYCIPPAIYEHDKLGFTVVFLIEHTILNSSISFVNINCNCGRYSFARWKSWAKN